MLSTFGAGALVHTLLTSQGDRALSALDGKVGMDDAATERSGPRGAEGFLCRDFGVVGTPYGACGFILLCRYGLLP